nr:YetF domain-containing protein [Micromonospora cremea]
MYLALFTLLRFILKRESGTTGVTDLLVIVLLADAAQNGLSGGYTSVTDGVLLVAVIIGWSYLLNAVAYRWPAAARLIRPGSLVLVRDGRIMRANMRRELITDEELYGLLRKQGVTDLAQVSEMRMESDGQFSVTTRTHGRSNDGDASGGLG